MFQGFPQVLWWENGKWKLRIINFFELHIFGGSFSLSIDELFAFRHFESVIIVPKVRADRNYRYRDYRLDIKQTQQVSIRASRNKINLSLFQCGIGRNTGIKQYPLVRASFFHALQHDHAHLPGTSYTLPQNVPLCVRMLKPNVYSAWLYSL